MQLEASKPNPTRKIDLTRPKIRGLKPDPNSSEQRKKPNPNNPNPIGLKPETDPIYYIYILYICRINILYCKYFNIFYHKTYYKNI